MVNSMTGFAAGTGALDAFVWAWDMRSVNGRGQDIRLRVPDWVSGLEAALKKKIAAETTRGTINLTLRLNREKSAGSMAINQEALDRVLASLDVIQHAADDRGLALVPPSSIDVLGFRGVAEEVADEVEDIDPIKAALLADFEAVFMQFQKMRANEGAMLVETLSGQLDQIQGLLEGAAQILADRSAAVADNLRANIAKIMENAEGVDEQRLTQELAILAVKSDITEEIDRLDAHIKAARKMLTGNGAVGRQLDFLMQEFNREANTLCSKSNFSDLTNLGLEMKTLIDQMREQVQNLE